MRESRLLLPTNEESLDKEDFCTTMDTSTSHARPPSGAKSLPNAMTTSWPDTLASKKQRSWFSENTGGQR